MLPYSNAFHGVITRFLVNCNNGLVIDEFHTFWLKKSYKKFFFEFKTELKNELDLYKTLSHTFINVCCTTNV